MLIFTRQLTNDPNAIVKIAAQGTHSRRLANMIKRRERKEARRVDGREAAKKERVEEAERRRKLHEKDLEEGRTGRFSWKTDQDHEVFQAGRPKNNEVLKEYDEKSEMYEKQRRRRRG